MKLSSVFIVGIGGAGMSGLARLLHAQGVSVAGSDAKDSKRLAALKSEGIEVFVGHSGQNLLDEKGVPRFETVAASTAVPANNAELQAARAANLEVLSRADLLSRIIEKHDVVAVAGTHGKTTTTSMLTIGLQAAGLDPAFAIGSELNELGSNAHLGSGQLFVVEADESDGTFLKLGSKYGIVTNLEADHLNYWETFEKLEIGFLDFVSGISERGGFVVMCADDPGSKKLADAASMKGLAVRTYGFSESSDYQIELNGIKGIGYSYRIPKLGLEVQLQVPGEHNVLNSAAAVIMAVGIGADSISVVSGIGNFTGTKRRFDFKGEVAGVRVFDDYAHHPTEIAATLKAARAVAGSGKVIAAFQAHHYYRTALFSKEFGEALGLADAVVVLEVFAPGETFIPGASGETLASNVPLPPSNVVFQPSWSAVPTDLVKFAEAGDLIITLGAGEIGLLTTDILQLLLERSSEK